MNEELVTNESQGRLRPRPACILGARGRVDLTGKFDTWGVGHTLLLGGDYWHDKLVEDFKFVFPFLPIDLFNPVHTGIPADTFRNVESDLVDNTDLVRTLFPGPNQTPP